MGYRPARTGAEEMISFGPGPIMATREKSNGGQEMKKSEVEFHANRYEVHAAVNVKLWGIPEADPEAVALEEGHPAEFAREFAAWYQDLPDQRREGFFEMARQDGWDRLQEDGRQIFGASAEVYSEGRQSGWAVVAADGHRAFTREDVAGWDAIALGKWARFCKWARQTCDDIPRSSIWLALANGYEPEHEAREERRRFSFYYETEGRFSHFPTPSPGPVHCPQCATERGVAIPAACPHF